MKFTVEIDEFWLDEDSDLDSALKSHVIHDVTRKIQASIEEKVNIQIAEKIKVLMEERLSPIIDQTITELMTTETILVNKNPVIIKERLKYLFQTNNGWNNPTEQIKKFAKNFGEEMKLQYNAAFANQIVANMKEQGFLKDEVTQILLGGTDKS